MTLLHREIQPSWLLDKISMIWRLIIDQSHSIFSTWCWCVFFVFQVAELKGSRETKRLQGCFVPDNRSFCVSWRCKFSSGQGEGIQDGNCYKWVSSLYTHIQLYTWVLCTSTHEFYRQLYHMSLICSQPHMSFIYSQSITREFYKNYTTTHEFYMQPTMSFIHSHTWVL